MVENRKISLCLISMLAIIMTAMTFLYRQESPFWISSQLLLLLGTVLFLGMTLFIYDARNFKHFALPGAILALGELIAVFSQFRLFFNQDGMRMETLSAVAQPIEILSAVTCVIEFVVLAWTVIDLSTDFSFCDMTSLILGISGGFVVAVDLVLLFFGMQGGKELFWMQSTACFSDLLTFGTVVVFYFGYTKERRTMYHYYRACIAEKKKSKRFVQIAEEEKAMLEEKELAELEKH